MRLTTKRGSLEVAVEITDSHQRGHISLPNGMGLDYDAGDGVILHAGVAINELTAGEDRDFLAGTPWHKHVPARLEPLNKGQPVWRAAGRGASCRWAGISSEQQNFTSLERSRCISLSLASEERVSRRMRAACSSGGSTIR